MRNPGDRFITPLMVLSLMFLVAGLHDLARSSPVGAGEGTPAGTAQTRPTQTQPAQTRPSQTQPSRPQPAKAAEPSPDKEASGEPRVFTDEDLEKYHDPSAAPSPRPTSAPVPAAAHNSQRRLRHGAPE